MRFIDVSLPLSEKLPAWPTDDPFQYWETETLDGGDQANCAHMSLSLHFGTHVDAPYHFVEQGKKVDELDLELLMGPCLVIDVAEAAKTIEPEHLTGKVPPGTRRLLLKTRNSAYLGKPEFRQDFVALSEASARLLVERGVRLLGLDYYSIGPYGRERPTHVAFLGAGGVAIENVLLKDVEPGAYELWCLPLKVEGAGGAPARVILGKPD